MGALFAAAVGSTKHIAVARRPGGAVIHLLLYSGRGEWQLCDSIWLPLVMHYCHYSFSRFPDCRFTIPKIVKAILGTRYSKSCDSSSLSPSSRSSNRFR